ncbi:MAG: hypothetical protein A3I61_08740 [Acidobacteria bacterium RIFCSPLOWO2_02_FULL_68_18]|nr:MAG: hypothetical protein A3I61_08740 [Acidobacteria bacterium RIFCSPLOWO2_02_FULL_68_18]OFW49803.1 MAG: hypothetical protein A3G77_01245 [Acidobacteria bacterium RIFCSPLOWO2_12_FULL_68_19]
MRVHRAVRTLGVGVALVALSASLAGQSAPTRPLASTRPWPPPLGPDGQPDVQGSWRPVIGGTHSLDPAKSGASDFEERIGGVVRNNPSRIVDPPDGRIPYQEWAAALQKGLEAVYENPTRPEHIDTQTRCLVPGVPRLYYFPTFRILQPPGSVVFVWDEYHAFRVVPVDGRPHVGSNIRLWMGDGRGRWEGHTLIVETANLKAKSRLDVVGDFFTDTARIVERFIFVDGDTMRYEATITDPRVFTRPWTMRVANRRMPEEEFWEWACHEGERDAANSSTRIDGSVDKR